MKKRMNMDNVVNWFGFNRAADKDGGSKIPRKADTIFG